MRPNDDQRSDEVIELTITTITHGGEGLARDAQGRVIFVPGALPGEHIRASIVETHAQYARAVLRSVLGEPAADRVAAPRCPYFGRWPERGEMPHRYCGGCDWQHVAYGAQLGYKAAILAEALVRHGHVRGIDVAAVEPAGPAWGYRNHLRLRATPDGLAFVAADGRSLVAVAACPIALPQVQNLIGALEGDLPSGTEIHLRAGAATADRLLALVLADEALAEMELATDLDASIVLVRSDGRLDVAAGQPYLVEELAGRRFLIPATSFFQTNTAVAATIIEQARAWLADGARILVDVYSGVGTFAIHLADLAQQVWAIESDPLAVAAAVENASGLSHLTLIEGTAEEGLRSLEVEPEAAIVDPPRSGLDAATLELLAGTVRGRIVYVSCDAVTLGRDARRLGDRGWHLAACRLVDMFPQTRHVESVSLFER